MWAMKKSVRYVDVVKAAGRVVRPELTEDQLDRAAQVIAANRRPGAKTVDMNHVYRVREAVRRAIGNGDARSPAPSGE